MINQQNNRLSHLSELNSILCTIDDDFIKTLAKLFSIQPNNPTSQRLYFQNIFIPQLYSDIPNIKDFFSELADNLEIIKKQIKPKKIFTRELISNSFHHFIIHDELKPESFTITLQEIKIKKIEVFMQIIPDGLLNNSNIQVLINGNNIKKYQKYFNSYFRIQYSDNIINLSFRKCPYKIIFLQVLHYRNLSQKQIETYFRTKLNIPEDIAKKKVIIHHGNHHFKFSQLINSFHFNDYVACPKCNKLTEEFYYGDPYNKNDVLDSIIDDNDEELINIIKQIECNHVFMFEYKMPESLRYYPPFISLCAFFDSKKCFDSLFDFYLKTNDFENIYKLDQCKRSVVHFAFLGGNLNIIQSILSVFKNFDLQDCFGLRPIHYSAMGGHIKVFEFLNEIKYDMFISDNQQNLTPFHIVCQYGHIEIAKYYYEWLIPNSKYSNFIGFLTNTCDCKLTPLHISCKYGHSNLVKYFLSKFDGAFYNFILSPMKTPLYYACKSDDISCINELFNFNCLKLSKVEIIKSFNISILNGNVDVAKRLISKYPIPIHSIAILDAINNNYRDLAKLLMEKLIICNQTKTNLIPWLHRKLFGKKSRQLKSSDIANNENFPNQLQNSEVQNIEICNRESIIEQQCANIQNDENCQNIKYHDDETPIEEQENKNLNEQASSTVPMPIISFNSMNNTSNPFIPKRFKSIPFSKIESKENKDHPQKPKLLNSIPKDQDPTSIGYFNHYGENGPTTFSDLLSHEFKTKEDLKMAIRNISVIDHRSIFIQKSEKQRLVFRCSSKCDFQMTWKLKEEKWKCAEKTFQNHTCSQNEGKKPLFHSKDIDHAIKSMSLNCTNFKSSKTILNNIFGSTVSSRCINSCLTQNSVHITDYWKILPSYLQNNILNGGLSDLHVTDFNEVYCFAMIPHYGKLLLNSDSILPVLIIDGTFQSSVYRGTIIIVMIVSSNRTNIPIAML